MEVDHPGQQYCNSTCRGRVEELATRAARAVENGREWPVPPGSGVIAGCRV
jgi:hypothetical protein